MLNGAFILCIKQLDQPVGFEVDKFVPHVALLGSNTYQVRSWTQDDQIDFQFSSNIWCKFYWILKHSNMVVDPSDLTVAVGAAVKHIKALKDGVYPMDAGLSHRFTLHA